MPTLTVLYPHFSRFDKENGLIPFAGAPGRMFIHRTFDLHPDLQLDIRPIVAHKHYSHKPLGDYILALGSENCDLVLGDKNINKHRGFRKLYQGKPTIVTYSHMDCWDFKRDPDDDDDDDKDSESNFKDVGATRRANYLYWSLTDFAKLLKPIQPHTPRSVNYHADIKTVTHLLVNAPKNQVISLDIETRPQDNTLDCIGFGFLVKSHWWIYTLPIYGPNNLRLHSAADMARFFRSFHAALSRLDITWVGHNLSFDLSILTHTLSLPFPRAVHDTMLHMHRDNPFIDKSLSHAISKYTDASVNHKGDFIANTSERNFIQLLRYNAEDVYWTGEVYLRQRDGITTAHQQAQESNYLLLLMSFTGIRIDEYKLKARKEFLELKTSQLLRVIRILTGRPEFNPNSPQQLSQYFFTHLDYEPVHFTAAGEPAADKTSLLSIQLKQYNPLVPIILAYKAASKELSTLGFKSYEGPGIKAV